MFLEVSIESQHFAVILKPWGLNAGNVIVIGCLSWSLEGEGVEGLCHLIKQMHIYFFFRVLALLLLAMVGVGELLCFVEVGFVRVLEDMSG